MGCLVVRGGSGSTFFASGHCHSGGCDRFDARVCVGAAGAKLACPVEFGLECGANAATIYDIVLVEADLSDVGPAAADAVG